MHMYALNQPTDSSCQQLTVDLECSESLDQVTRIE